MPVSTAFLLRIQRNNLYELIQHSGLNIQEFTLEDEPDTGARLTHQPTGFFVHLQACKYDRDCIDARFSPDFTYESQPARYGQDRLRSWYWVQYLVNRWLTWVYWEWHTPDLWAPKPAPLATKRRQRKSKSRQPDASE